MNERRVIQIIWWIGLAGALVATLAVLKQVSLVLRALQDIHELAQMTQDAARGIVRNVAPVARLDELSAPAQDLDRTTLALADTAGAIERKLSRVTV